MNFNEVCHFFLLNSKNMAPFSTNFDPISIVAAAFEIGMFRLTTL